MAFLQDVQTGVQIQPSANGLETFIHLSQGENGRKLYIKILGIDEIPTGSVATISGTKPDGNVYSAAGIIDDITIVFNEDIQMTVVAGIWDANVKIVNEGNTIASAKLRFVIHESAVASGAVPSDSQLDGIVAECQMYAEAARSAAYGSPLTASVATDMIDTSKVYVYTGNETGYTAGHWYYYNGTAWADGGVYNSIAIQTDTTLTLPDHAADAKATGDALATKADKIGNIALAERLYGGEYTSESEPYHFRQAPEGMGAKDETIVGGSLAWNQLADMDSLSGSHYAEAWASTITKENGKLKVASTRDYTEMGFNFVTDRLYVQGHKYLLLADIPKCSFTMTSSSLFITDGWSQVATGIVKTGVSTSVSGVVSANSSGTIGTNQRMAMRVGGTVTTGDYIEVTNAVLIDLTQMFGSTIADYIYSLEQSSAGAGVAWVKRYIDLDTYHEYDAGSIQSVEGLQSHKTYDDDENLLATYPLDSSITLRGVPKLVTDHLEFDGDKYKSDGTLERRYGERAYQSGDESLANAITDGTTTVYKLTTPTTETAQPFQSPMIVGATEEYVSDSIVPVGHESKYYEDVAKKVNGLPKDFSTLIAPTEVTFTATRNYSVGSYLIVKNQLYKVTSAISSGGTITPNSNVTATTIMAEILALA